MERRARLLALPLAAAAPLTLAPRLSSEEPQDRLRVDASAVGAKISPWVYGQFIEHLGRCIYGGLWAEMLEDRKFYYPVTGPRGRCTSRARARGTARATPTSCWSARRG